MSWQQDFTMWPDIETLVPALLRERMAEEADHIGASRTPGWTGRIVTVRRDGGGVSGLFDRPRITVRVWADDRNEVVDLAALVRSHILDLRNTAGITDARCFSGPNLLQDDTAPAAFMTFELTVRPD